MAKTFDEWFKENLQYLDSLVKCEVYKYGTDAYVTDKSLENIVKVAWEASRQNMTTKDI